MTLSSNTPIISRGILLRQEAVEDNQLESFMEAINRLSRSPLRSDQVYIRSMYLCSDRLCPQDWGRFSPAALEQICKLTVGQSVLVGHDRSRLPIARFFKAEVVRRPDDLSDEEGNEVHWVRAWFYWLRDTSGAKDLLLNIDGGIYREVSISWKYRSASCSICHNPIDKCEHVPGKFYGEQRCTYLIEEVSEVLEGSIVYKGAEKDTRLDGCHQSRTWVTENLSASGSAKENLSDNSWPDKNDWDECLEILHRQEIDTRSLLVITDDIRAVLPVLWIGKLSGWRIKVLIPEDAKPASELPGGVDHQRGWDCVGQEAEWDLLYIRMSRQNLLRSELLLKKYHTLTRCQIYR